MTRPTTAATWDSNDTNTVPVTGGHQTDGWGIDEVPTSTEMNGWQKNVAEWVAWFDANNAEVRTLSIPIGPPALIGLISDVGISGADQWSVGIPIEGETPIALVYADKVFTAANATEIFTAAAHGLKTGDGPFNVSNSGGALPAGLAAATPYWIIKIDANTFYLATSLANALIGTHLSITTDGTGTQTISDTVDTVRLRGRKIVAIRARVKDNATDPTRMRVQLIVVADGVSAWNVASPATSGAAGTVQTLLLDLSASFAGTIVVGSGLQYQATFDLTTGNDLCHIYSLEVDHVPL